ncbi:DUF6114 domain-containing protein [Klenkia sp. LSe6-5]|uniref:DUF6114 domain-containing protein n=1 Tax=Klenkia sesuvii TaxID=3103137 RepID=A0ABU8DU26_9ACTN
MTRFRRTRPFWGCLILALGGWFVLRPAVGSFSLLLGLGVGGAQVYILGGGMIAAALVALVKPDQRFFPAIMAMIFSVASLPLANLGGWLLGMVLGIVGSGMVFAWTPYTQQQLDQGAEGHDPAEDPAEDPAHDAADQAGAADDGLEVFDGDQADETDRAERRPVPAGPTAVIHADADAADVSR